VTAMASTARMLDDIGTFATRYVDDVRITPAQ
jgi:hypothetical protein